MRPHFDRLNEWDHMKPSKIKFSHCKGEWAPFNPFGRIWAKIQKATYLWIDKCKNNK